MPPSLRWDVFCRIVDNYGDAGVCWRLARQLHREHGLAVTLWIDDIAFLARFVPGLAVDRADQAAYGVRVRRLDSMSAHDLTLPDVVVEGFGCGLPDVYLAAMTEKPRSKDGSRRLMVRSNSTVSTYRFVSSILKPLRLPRTDRSCNKTTRT